MALLRVRMRFIASLLLPLMAVYTLCRLLFVFYNAHEFDLSGNHFWSGILWNGLRFDLSAILFSNAMLILYILMPFRAITRSASLTLIRYVYGGVNGLFILLNGIDMVYFPFVQKRMQSDVFLFATGDKGSEALHMIPAFLWQYAWLWLLSGALIYLLNRAYTKTAAQLRENTSDARFGFLYFLSIPLWIALVVIGIRGGLQLRPIAVINASEADGVKNAPAVLNSTFSLIRTWNKKSIQPRHDFPETEFSTCENGVHTAEGLSAKSETPNVVIILVESLSRQYLSYFNGHSKTPFLDSLMKESLVFTQAFANARESVQGIPAVLSSIPSLMDEPFIFSRYASNQINSVASLLKKKNYTSCFFHGASTGTMGFSSFCHHAGFDHYYGRENYNNNTDFDGSWGIWDHKFLDYMAGKLSEVKPPFVAAVLTLNSHHPFKLPAGFEKDFFMEGHPILSSIRYTDYSLSLFFNKIKKEPWFKNTLFVITADHTGPNVGGNNAAWEDFSVPIIFYRQGSTLKGQNDRIANQIDIMPTVLNYLKADTTYFSMGQNLLSEACPAGAVNYQMGIYQYIDRDFCLMHNGEKSLSLYKWKEDAKMQNNLISDKSFEGQRKTMEKQLLKRIQLFNNSMLNDQMTISHD